MSILYINIYYILNIFTFVYTYVHNWGFSSSSVGRICHQYIRCRRCGFDPRVAKIPLRRAWQPTPVFLPGESHEQRSLRVYSPQDYKQLDTIDATKHVCIHIHKHLYSILVFKFFSAFSVYIGVHKAKKTLKTRIENKIVEH